MIIEHSHVLFSVEIRTRKLLRRSKDSHVVSPYRDTERLYSQISGHVYRMARRYGGNIQLLREHSFRTAFATASSSARLVTAMASTADIARLLNLDDLDSSALADVITEYFGDRKASAADSADEEESGNYYTRS